MLDTVRDGYKTRIRDAEATLQETQLLRHELRAGELTRPRHLLQVVKAREIDGFPHGTMSSESYAHPLADLDARLVDLESGRDEDRESPPAPEPTALPDGADS